MSKALQNIDKPVLNILHVTPSMNIHIEPLLSSTLDVPMETNIEDTILYTIN